jgi:glycosyltransferase involved in cell wall biosynthesis
MTETSPKVAIAHDYLTQRGGAERVVLAMLKAFPDAPLYTSIYVPEATFPEFAQADVHSTWLGSIPMFRRDHRLALPFLAQAFASRVVDADVVICSSSGWAHGVSTAGQKLVYCYTPARWLYQPDKYLGTNRYRGSAPVMAVLRPLLIRWDKRSARGAARYLTSSSSVRERIKRVYGIDAVIVPPPHSRVLGALQSQVAGLEPNFFLCVARLLSYKNVEAIIRAVAQLDGARLVVVGDGPERTKLARLANARITMIRQANDQELNWLYANCIALVAAGYEDFGLTPIEAASFGKPSAVLRWGGYTDTVSPGLTGVFFDTPTPERICAALIELLNHHWDRTVLVSHAGAYSEGAFVDRLRREVALLLENVSGRRDRSPHAARPE